MALLRNLFWIALFLASTFGFVVLFEHGPHDYVKSCQVEFDSLKTFANKKIERKKDESHKIGE